MLSTLSVVFLFFKPIKNMNAVGPRYTGHLTKVIFSLA